MNKKKMSVVGRVLSIIFGIIAMIMALGDWLDIYQVPMIMKRYLENKYSLLEIYDFLDTFNMYVGSSKIEMYADILLLATIAVIIVNLAAMILSGLGKQPAKVLSIVSSTLSIVLSGAVVGFVVKTNLYVEDVTYGGVDKLLRLTLNPWLLILFSVLQSVCLRISAKETSYSPNSSVTGQVQCVNCGAFLQNGAMFCNRCGAKAEIPKPSPKFCTSCGNSLSPGAVFCPNCGSMINKGDGSI